ncbi:MAG: GNAT family N-acetyltransferase [Phycisphaerae bacterium]|nr:GNAT family N-acetyltransferase [Phycisphaerae bacterium]
MTSKPPPILSVRPATRGDVPLILALIRELADYERAPQDARATADDLDRNLFGQGYGRGPVAECLIGLIDNQPQGFALFFSNFSTWVGRSGIYLEDLFVRPAARGSGLGKALLREVARIAVARNCGRMEWSVLDWNTPAIGFYKSLGAIAMDEWTTHRMTADAIKALAKSDASD